METIKTLAEKLKNIKETKTREQSGKKFITYDFDKLGDLGKRLQDCVREAHLEESPNDFAYSIVDDALDYIIGENIETLEQFSENSCYYESIERSIPSYNSALIEWLSDDMSRAEYLNQYVENCGTLETHNLFQLMTIACGEHVKQIFEKFGAELSELADELNAEEVTA